MSEQRSSGERGSTQGTLGLRIAAIVILVFSVVVLYQAIRIASEGGYGLSGSGFFPLVVGAGLVFFSVLFLASVTVSPDQDLKEYVAEEEEATHWPTVGLVVVALLVYAFLLAPLGYVVATTLFFLAVARILGSRRFLRDLIVGLVASVLIYVGFALFLGVRLPAGVLEFIL